MAGLSLATFAANFFVLVAYTLPRGKPRKVSLDSAAAARYSQVKGVGIRESNIYSQPFQKSRPTDNYAFLLVCWSVNYRESQRD
jgi:hypothetical protein